MITIWQVRCMFEEQGIGAGYSTFEVLTKNELTLPEVERDFSVLMDSKYKLLEIQEIKLARTIQKDVYEFSDFKPKLPITMAFDDVKLKAYWKVGTDNWANKKVKVDNIKEDHFDKNEN